VIDARDLGAWMLDAAESSLGGTYDAVGPQTTRGEALETIRSVTGGDAELVWVDPEFLAAEDVGEWMELPLWLRSAEYAAMLSIDPVAAFTAGLKTRPLEETTRDTLAWIRTGDTPDDPPAGLAREKERLLLDKWLSKH
jgi:nucleoside-diphosphate-sugar epimerase